MNCCVWPTPMLGLAGVTELQLSLTEVDLISRYTRHTGDNRGDSPNTPVAVATLSTRSDYCSGTPWKVAVIDLAELMVTVQVAPETVSHPLQPVKMLRGLGVAVRVTTVSAP